MQVTTYYLLEYLPTYKRVTNKLIVNRYIIYLRKINRLHSI